MPQSFPSRLPQRVLLLGLFLAVLRWVLPLALPFLGGALLALTAERPVRFLCQKLRFSRGIAAFLGVSLTLLMLLSLGLLLFSAAFHGLRQLARILPNLESAVRQGLFLLEDRLLSLATAAPEGLRDLLIRSILSLFDNGSALFAQAAAALPGLAAGLFSHITGGILGVGTGILSAYLISARLPDLVNWFREHLPELQMQGYRSAFDRSRQVLGGWLKAQGLLAGLTFCILLAGLWLLRIPHAPVWAALIALMDAVPMLGTGLALIPWSTVCFLQDEPVRAFGLLGIFAAATLARSALEPRLVGREIGLDPLLTLIALYLGYQLLGFPGLLAAPLLAAAAVQLFKTTPEDR